MKGHEPYRHVDHDSSRRQTLHKAIRIRDALAGSPTTHNMANGQIASSREIVDALTACIHELDVLVCG